MKFFFVIAAAFLLSGCVSYQEAYDECMRAHPQPAPTGDEITDKMVRNLHVSLMPYLCKSEAHRRSELFPSFPPAVGVSQQVILLP